MTWHKRFASRVHALFQKRRLERELDEELRLHLEMQTEEYIENGMSPEEARRAVYSSFGGMDQVKEACRDRWSFLWLDSLWRDLGYAVRSLRNSPGFTTVAILSLALGIGANTTIFTVVNAVLLRPPPFKDAERLVVVTEGSGHKLDELDRPKERYISAWKRHSETLESLAAADPFSIGITLAGEGTTETLEIARGGMEVFRVLGIEPLLGRTFLPEDFEAAGGNYLSGGPNWANAVVLSHELWERHFGADPNVVGQTISTDRMGNPVIIGVMPPGTWVFPWQRDVELWTANDFSESEEHGRWQSAVARLKPGVTREQAREELELIARRADAADDIEQDGGQIEVHPLQAWSTQDYTKALYLFFGVVGFVLLIACGNVANLCLGRALGRRKEMVARAALGAGRGRLIRQLLTESILLASAAGLAGLMLAQAGVRLFVYLAPSWYPPADDYRLDLPVLAFTMGVSLLTGILFGLAPALNAGRIRLNEVLREGGRQGTAIVRRTLGAPLVVSQVALAVVLLVGAGLMINTLLNLVRANPGFNANRLLAVDLSLRGPRYATRNDSGERSVTPGAENFFREAHRRIEALPGVRSAGLSHRMPTRSTYRLPFRITGEPEPRKDDEPRAGYSEVSSNYFQVAEIPLLEGRHFTELDTADSLGVAIVNKALVDRYFPGQDALGSVIQVLLGNPFDETTPRVSDRPRTIVGVVADSMWRRLNREPFPEVYFPMSQHPSAYPSNPMLSLHLRKGMLIRTEVEPLSLSQEVQETIEGIDPHVSKRIRTMKSDLAFSYQEQRFWLQLLGLFSGVALLLAAIGLYGVIAYAVTQRTHEFGIRMALGAERSNVLSMVLGNGLRLSLLGIGIGLVSAFGLTRFIESQLYGVTPTDPLTFTGVAAVLLAVALLASYLPARRAIRVDPMQALRYE